ncbi:tail fiber protein [Marinicella sp. S1101]|uniref:phage tail protein n=1 Tax=Marinicella marina TaxID=2996016 RepID=UPI002260F0C5|nr:tail fiber protein [Marinicella marina]MCX7554487.1 tail fiber protein [Marinicella marina]MDJ1140638.1 tail fiber protein [Marinicella marina]
MSEPFVGEIRMFAGNFAPRGWAFCDGQLLAVSQNDALFSLLGTIYGGDGRTTFGLPDMRGRLSLHAGQGPGLSNRRLGAKAGAENVTLTVNQLPSHRHAINATTTGGDNANPLGNKLAESSEDIYTDELDNPSQMNSSSLSNTGGSQSHTNIMPFLCINYIIALVGIYPSRQ